LPPPSRPGAFGVKWKFGKQKAEMVITEGKTHVRWGKTHVRWGKMHVRWGKTHVRYPTAWINRVVAVFRA